MSFRFKAGKPGEVSPRSFGLIAEEVAAVMPELVIYDESGRPQGVRYNLLSSLLLDELQKQHRKDSRAEQAFWSSQLGLVLLAGLTLIAIRRKVA